jgi:hypothetical protein
MMNKEVSSQEKQNMKHVKGSRLERPSRKMSLILALHCTARYIVKENGTESQEKKIMNFAILNNLQGRIDF